MNLLREIDALKAALQQSMVALDDWLNTYADDLCDPKRVDQAWERIKKRGTIGYISEVQAENRRAISGNIESKDQK